MFRYLQGFAVVFAVVATLILATNTVYFIGRGEYDDLALMWLIAPLFYGMAAFFFWLGRSGARRLERDAREFGSW